MRVSNRLRVCAECKTEYELGVEGGRHKYCSLLCSKQNHYKKWSASGRRNPDKIKDQRLRREFGIDLIVFERMLVSQNNKCSCCGISLSGKRDTHVDHCHTSGKVRSLLCSCCNQALGLVKENKETLRNMILYLEEHDER